MKRFLLILMMITVSVGCSSQKVYHELPSWNEGDSRTSIIKFVNDVTSESSPHYVAPSERIAVFDNDGTLWAEQPTYVQLQFAMERIKELSKDNPSWKNKQPYKAVLEGDKEAMVANGKKGLLEIVMASHGDITTEEFSEIVSDWLDTARHPKTGRKYTEMVYQPMLELLNYLRANEFKTFIVSGGGVEFIRPWAEKVYGIPPEQVVGSSIKVKFEMRDGEPTLAKLPEIDFIDDKEGKPVAINLHIGRRPIAAFGNSDGDLQMVQWTTAGEGRRFGLFVRHTDAEREWAYDRDSHIGKFDEALDLAGENDWVVVDMKQDWNRVFPFNG